MCGFKKHTTYAIVFLRTHLVFLSSSVCYEVSTNNSESEVKWELNWIWLLFFKGVVGQGLVLYPRIIGTRRGNFNFLSNFLESRIKDFANILLFPSIATSGKVGAVEDLLMFPRWVWVSWAISYESRLWNICFGGPFRDSFRDSAQVSKKWIKAFSSLLLLAEWGSCRRTSFVIVVDVDLKELFILLAGWWRSNFWNRVQGFMLFLVHLWMKLRGTRNWSRKLRLNALQLLVWILACLSFPPCVSLVWLSVFSVDG